MTKRLCALILMNVVALGNAADYPAWRGDGSGAAVDAGHELVQSLAAAKLVWKSAERLPAVYNHRINDADGPDGGYCNPSVHAGDVFLQYFVPTGEHYDEPSLEAARSMKSPEIWRTDADDVIIRIDGRTGETIWKRSIKGAANIWALGGGLHTNVALADGRTYVVGAMGAVYCLDAETGTDVWRSSLGPSHARHRRTYADWLESPDKFAFPSKWREKRYGGGKPSVLGEVFICSPRVMGGVLVIPDSSSRKLERSRHWSASGIVGLDLQTGALRWRVENCIGKAKQVVPWRRDGRRYAIGVTRRGDATCIDADTGEVLWRQEGLSSANFPTPAISGDLLVTAGNKNAGITCYRLRPQGAEMLWTQARPEGHKSGSLFSSPLIYRGHVYNKSPWQKGRRGHNWVCLRLADGKLQGTVESDTKMWASPVAGDGRMLHGFLYFATDPEDFRLLGGREDFCGMPDWGGAPSCITAPIVDGRIYARGSHHVYCYDLKR